MITDDKISKLIADLTKATISGSLKWEMRRPPSALVEGTNDVFPAYFQVKYKHQHLGIAKRRFKYFTDFDEFSWRESVVLIFLDFSQQIIWEYENEGFSLTNLFSAIQKSSVDIDSLIGGLIDDS